MIGPLLAALGTRNRYSATSLDQLPHVHRLSGTAAFNGIPVKVSAAPGPR